ncbi:MAG: hypothetical protein LUD72_03875 [Bacteroidales bacterium]|nr:hypothetical protein [Bacteroidales bacterium]
MKLSDAKQQAIGKHLFINGWDWGKVKGFDYDYFYRNSVIADFGRVHYLSVNMLSNLLQGRIVKMRSCIYGFIPFGGYNIYEIREEEKPCNGQTKSKVVWSPSRSPISPIWQHMKGISIDELGKSQRKLYKPRNEEGDE